MMAPLQNPVFVVRKGERMSQNEMKETAQEIAEGLKRLGSNRVVALSVHVSKDLIEELEIKANKLVVLLESAS
jgi:hypothetical protein